MIARDAHLNLIDSSRQLFELDPGAETIFDYRLWMCHRSGDGR